MTRQEIITATQNVFHHFTETCFEIGESTFFEKPGNKWSIAENVQHLILSTNTTTLAYLLPKFLVRWVGGKPNRPSRSFDEMLSRYNKKLEEGGKASSRYVPRPIPVNHDKKRILNNWNRIADKYIYALNTRRTEEDLDHYLVKHPLLGRITLRELCYFTVFHTRHHLDTIVKIREAMLS